jgi:hypothetical protein
MSATGPESYAIPPFHDYFGVSKTALLVLISKVCKKPECKAPLIGSIGNALAAVKHGPFHPCRVGPNTHVLYEVCHLTNTPSPQLQLDAVLPALSWLFSNLATRSAVNCIHSFRA